MKAHIISVNDVNQALYEALWWIKITGIVETSRNGPVLVAPGPVITEYATPQHRVLYSPARDANPVFHLVEAAWMLAGRNLVEELTPFNAGMAAYANQGVLHGAYGHRWRSAMGFDQLRALVQHLEDNPESRRAVLQMWDAHQDLGVSMNDIPCNTHVYLDLRGGRLNMTVCCRSNDIVWGAYGANVVHFSFLQEWLSAALGVPMGVYTQMSNNFHIYTENEAAKRCLKNGCEPEYRVAPAIPLVACGENAWDFLYDCELFFENLPMPPRTYFAKRVLWPLAHAYLTRKNGGDWAACLVDTPHCDWRVAFEEWAARRDEPAAD